MKNYKLALISCLSFILTNNAVYSQTFLGLQHSNMSGIHQANLNPANIANSRHKLYINGLTAGVGFNNDYLKLNFPFPVMNLITGNVPNQYKTQSGSIDFQENWLQEDVNGKAKNFNLFLATRTPGVMYQISKGLTIGLQYKNTLNFQINNVAEPLARLARHGIDSSNGGITYSGPNNFTVGTTYGDNAFNININAYGELAGTIAKTIIKTDNILIKAGFTPKLLFGYATGYIKNNGMQIRAPGSDSIIFGKTDVEYGYTDPSFYEDISTINIDFLKNKALGKGFGYDIGGTFEYSPKSTEKITNKKNNYLFRAGISLLDAGNIKYSSGTKNTRIINNSGEKALLLDSNFARAWGNGEETGIRYTDSVMRTIFQIDTSSNSITTKMPTTINLQFDYNVFKIFYVGANLSQSLRDKRATGIRRPSYLTVIPRIETKLFEVALPMGLMNDYRNGRMGLFVRVGPVFVGSDNIIGQLKSNNIYGADFYFGISTGIPTKKASKKDDE
ncbi:MAG: DUF5723 family protein [Bacteroidota bacterium]|nr:DUF5723 family protein [Bacteroidota bacterium]